MSKFEHLLLLQRQQGIEVGDTVKVYPFASYINNNPYFNEKMKAFREGVVVHVQPDGRYSVRCDGAEINYQWPATHVVLHRKKEVKRSVTLNSEYTAHVYADRVVVGCQTIHIDRIRDILDVAIDLGRKS